VDCEAGSEEEKREKLCGDFLVYQGKNTKKHGSKTVTVACKRRKNCYTAGVPSFVLYLCHFLWERHKYILVTDWRQDIDSGKNNAPLFRL
jgi:hypothetical protein